LADAAGYPNNEEPAILEPNKLGTADGGLKPTNCFGLSFSSSGFAWFPNPVLLPNGFGC
jgi:hypothetical protein